MKTLIRICLIISLSLSIFVFTGCKDITKSHDYATYKLKYIVNLTHVNEDQQGQILDKNIDVINSRLSYFDVADVSIKQEKDDENSYITVEFGTIDDINEIKSLIEMDNSFQIKKNIEGTETEEEYEPALENKAKETLDKILAGENFQTTAQNDVLADPDRVVFINSQWMYKDEIKDVFAEKLFEMENNSVYPELIMFEEKQSALSPLTKVFSIIKLRDKKEVERVTSFPKEVQVSHILIAYKDALRSSETITRTKDEAENLANEIHEKLENGSDFSALAQQYSNDESNNKLGGVLEQPAGQGIYVEEFEEAALGFEEEGDLSEVTESDFGYHIIKANEVFPAFEEKISEEQVSFSIIFYVLIPSKWQDLDFKGRDYVINVNIFYDKEYNPFLVLKLNTEGKNLLKELTDKNNGQILGVFVGNQLLTSFSVKEINESGEITILKPNTTKEADNLKRDLLMKELAAPIILIEES